MVRVKKTFKTSLIIQPHQITMPDFFKYSTHQHRVARLDVLRGVAVLMTTVHHLPLAYYSNLPPLLKNFLTNLSGCGWMGVDLFFVLSGFLVSGLIFAELKKYKDFRLRPLSPTTAQELAFTIAF